MTTFFVRLARYMYFTVKSLDSYKTKIEENLVCKYKRLYKVYITES